MENISMAPMPLSSMVCRKAEKLPNPHVPRRVMYPRCPMRDAPVAEQYSTRACGSARCNRSKKLTEVRVSGRVLRSGVFRSDIVPVATVKPVRS
eukprot:9331101-Pyramimonas_sp.AAC.2